MIPSRLLRRWEHALEDVALWRFNSTVIHGDLHEDQLLVEDAKVVAVTGWTDLQFSDPADDFAWLAAVHEQSLADAAFEGYVAVRGDRADPHIMRRAAPLPPSSRLRSGWSRPSPATCPAHCRGRTMLEELDNDIAEYGGQPISVVDRRVPRGSRPWWRRGPQSPCPLAAISQISRGSTRFRSSGTSERMPSGSFLLPVSAPVSAPVPAQPKISASSSSH